MFCQEAQNLFNLKTSKLRSSGMAELANASVVHSRDLGSNLSTDRKYLIIMFVSHLNSYL
jgi:hypothetical protein